MIDFMLFGGFGIRQTDRQTDERTDIGSCRVAFATEKSLDKKVAKQHDKK